MLIREKSRKKGMHEKHFANVSAPSARIGNGFETEEVLKAGLRRWYLT